MFFLYQLILTLLIFTIAPLIFFYRIFKNKEDKKRFIEKLSLSTIKRKKGKLIWFHGASVGELLSIIPLIRHYEKDKSIQQILVTSSTLSSSKVLKKFSFKKTIHQFYPIDHLYFVNKFITYWKPNISIQEGLSHTYKCLLPLLSELKTIFLPSGEKLAETSIEALFVTLFDMRVLRSRIYISELPISGSV